MSVTIPDSVTLIDVMACWGCCSLKSVTIGSGVTSIGVDAFFACSSLVNITFKDTTTWYYTNSKSNWEQKTGGSQFSVTNSATNVDKFQSYYYWYKL